MYDIEKKRRRNKDKVFCHKDNNGVVKIFELIAFLMDK